MGSGTSCCGSNGPIPRSVDQISDKKAMKQQRSKQSRCNLDSPLLQQAETQRETRSNVGEMDTDLDIFMEDKAKCITSANIEECPSLQRIIKVIIKYNEWLKSTNPKISDDPNEDHTKFNAQIENMINSIPNYSMKLFFFDCNLIRQHYHYQMIKIREFLLDNLSKKDNVICSKHDSFSMQYSFLRNKQPNETAPTALDRLARTHVFLFHSVYISELKVHHIHPRNAYLVATYLERKQRIFKLEAMPSQIVHLCALYYAGKYIEDNDNLDQVTALKLSDFLEQTMNTTTLNRIWSTWDVDGDEEMDENEIDRCLLLIVMIFVTSKAKESGCVGPPRINKTELKELMRPIGDWLKRDKMKKQKIIKKDEFKSLFVEWLREYHDTNGGIVADEEMQMQVLKMHGMNEKKIRNGDIEENKEEAVANKSDFNRLVINCEYLPEHKSMKDVYTKDDDYDEAKHGSELNPNAKSVNSP